MTATTGTNVDQPPLLKHMTGQPQGDRYDRLANSVAILADDDIVKAGEPPYNAEGLQAFAAGFVEKRLLDDLTEADADTVAMISLLDYTAGLQKMAWRISDICSPEPTVQWEYHNEVAVVRRLAYILYLFLGAIQGDCGDNEML